MNGWMRAAAAGLLGLALVYGIARASLASYTPAHRRYATPVVAGNIRNASDDAVGRTSLLRLSWRIRGEPVRSCRILSPAEVEALPQHMRRDEVCETRVEPYRLQVDIDGQRVLADTLHAAGARQDRPIYVYYDLPLAPGEYAIDVRFEQVGPADVDDVALDGHAEPPGDTQQEIGGSSQAENNAPDASVNDQAPEGQGGAEETAGGMRLLVHRGTVRLEPGEIGLVTYNADTRTLVLRRPSTMVSHGPSRRNER